MPKFREMSDAPFTQPATGSVLREAIHTRNIVGQGYLRSDGLWDIECELIDTKSYSFTNPDGHFRAAGEPVHAMLVRLTIDDEMRVREAMAVMRSTPFPECPGAERPFPALVGARVGRGWRRAVDEAMGGERGCTHLRELLSVAATVAYQAINGYRNTTKRKRGEATYSQTIPGHQMGECVGWDFNGGVIARVTPQFIGLVRKPKL